MDEIKEGLVNYLYDDSQWLPHLFALVELKTNIRRESIAIGCFLGFGIYLVIGHFAELVCNFTAFAYPAYASMLAIETEEKEDDTQWLTYWCVFAFFSLVDFLAEEIYKVFPFYWLVKCALLIYLYHPATMGAQHLYVNYTRPYLQQWGGLLFSETNQLTGETDQQQEFPTTTAEQENATGFIDETGANRTDQNGGFNEFEQTY